jgi:hypothetical protein
MFIYRYCFVVVIVVVVVVVVIFFAALEKKKSSMMDVARASPIIFYMCSVNTKKKVRRIRCVAKEEKKSYEQKDEAIYCVCVYSKEITS